jgi:hypothetical protein
MGPSPRRDQAIGTCSGSSDPVFAHSALMGPAPAVLMGHSSVAALTSQLEGPDNQWDTGFDSDLLVRYRLSCRLAHRIPALYSRVNPRTTKFYEEKRDGSACRVVGNGSETTKLGTAMADEARTLFVAAAAVVGVAGVAVA